MGKRLLDIVSTAIRTIVSAIRIILAAPLQQPFLAPPFIRDDRLQSSPTSHPKCQSGNKGQNQKKIDIYGIHVTPRRAMLYVTLIAASAAFGFLATMAGNNGHRTACIWLTYFAVMTAVATVFAGYQNYLDDNSPSTSKTTEHEITGLLTPGSDTTPKVVNPAHDGMPEHKLDFSIIPVGFIAVIFGNAIGWTDTLPLNVLNENDENIIRIEGDRSGIFVSGVFCGDDGLVIGDIDKNEFHLRTEAKGYWRSTRTAHRLSVKSLDGKTMFEVEFINPKTIRIYGNFYSRNGKSIVANSSSLIIGKSRLSGNSYGSIGVSRTMMAIGGKQPTFLRILK